MTSFLMHALSRHVAWHTELFFTPEQFEVFWQTHGQLPLRKIQLRYLRRDGLPHSPFATTTACRLTCSCSAGTDTGFSRLSQEYVHRRSEPTPANTSH